MGICMYIIQEKIVKIRYTTLMVSYSNISSLDKLIACIHVKNKMLSLN